MMAELYSIYVNLRQMPNVEGGLIQVYIPFSTSDPYNWKSHSKELGEDPEGFLNWISRII